MVRIFSLLVILTAAITQLHALREPTQDKPPTITLVDPSSSERITKNCQRPIELEVKDDRGVRSVWISYQVIRRGSIATTAKIVLFESNKPEKIVRIPAPDKPAQVLDFGKIEWKSGDGPDTLDVNDVVNLLFHAEDNREPKTNTTVSKELKFTVSMVEEVEKEIFAGLAAQRKEIEKLTDRQKSLKKKLDSWLANRQYEAGLKFEIGEASEHQRSKVAQNIETIRIMLLKLANRGNYCKALSPESAAIIHSAIQDLCKAGPGEDPSQGKGINTGTAFQAAISLTAILKLTDKDDRKKALEQAIDYQTQTINLFTSAAGRLLEFPN